MNIFKKLLVTSTILGVAAPVAVMAGESNMTDVEKYSTAEQVTSISQFSDVQPTDWAYQALSNLVERYGCVAGYPDGTYRGGRTMTRYEAAALLNACLDRVTEVTDELRKLQAEFAQELAVLRGRVDGLEGRVGVLESQQFSTTTKLKGEATFVLGGVPGLETNDGGNVGNTAFNYDLRLNFDTSFTGEDLLRARLRSGNFSSDPFGSSASLFKLDKAETTDNQVELDRLYYQFPVKLADADLTITAGALVRNTEMAWIPTAYKSEILDFFQLAGAPGVYNKATGAGVGVQYGGQTGFVAGLNYVAQDGDDSETGMFDSEGALNVLGQLGYRGTNWGAAVAYRYGTEGSRVRSFNALNGGSANLVSGQESNGVAISAYWQPVNSGLIPSISAGYGYNDVDGSGPVTGATDSDSWYVGLQWDDVFADGNTAGVAVGQPGNTDENNDDAVMLEVFYKYQVTDNISITPAVFYVSNNERYGGESEFGGVIQTKFKF